MGVAAVAAQGLATRKVSAPPPIMTLSLWVFHVSVGDRQTVGSLSPHLTAPPQPPAAQPSRGWGELPQAAASELFRDEGHTRLLRGMGPSGLAQDSSALWTRRSWPGVSRQLFLSPGLRVVEAVPCRVGEGPPCAQL